MSYSLFLSHSLESLADRLMEECEANPVAPLQRRTLLVPNGSIKQWLFLRMAQQKGVVLGWKVITPQELFPKSSSTEIFCSLYNALREAADDSLLAYLGGKKGRLLQLTNELVSLFFTYGQYGKVLFNGEGKPLDWQQALLRKLFVDGHLRMPVQCEWESFPLIVFGIDELPVPFWELLFQAPSLSIYLFSPCQEFWEDLCTDRERRRLNRYGKKKGASEASLHQLGAYLRDAPPLLANWGKLGRETLKAFDAFSLQIEEVFPSLQPTSLLTKLQHSLLHFHSAPKGELDSSIQIFQTGSSRLREIEQVRDEILRLGVPFQDVAVLAPNMQPYVPLIEFVFGEEIPYRISGFDMALQSSFRLGLLHLLDLGRWEAGKVLALFETPSFYRKQGWNGEKLGQFREWITEYRIKWGLDRAQCQQILRETFGEKNYEPQGFWEEGLDQMLDTLIYLRDKSIDSQLFEEFLTVFFALKKISLTGEKPLAVWADELEALVEQFLFVDLEEEADGAVYPAFQRFLRELRIAGTQTVPFEVIRKLLFRVCPGQIHASHLHAVRFAPLEEAALLPAQALFLIGMDEGSFPRANMPSSLDLLRRQKIIMPEPSDRDRYLFLEALFSAQQYLRISYGHLSAEEGKPIAPALPVQELMSETGLSPIPITRPSFSAKKPTSWEFSLHKCPEVALPEGEITLSLSDLRTLARHPWRFFLQKTHGIYLNEALEDSFSLQKGRLLRATLEKPLEEIFSELPPGLFGEALRLDVEEKAAEWQKQLKEWNLKPFTLILRENCSAKQWEGPHCIVPPIELRFDRLTVRLVGEVKNVVSDGLLCTYDDHISGVLKSWPEALVVALSLNAPHLYMLKNGKKKALPSADIPLKSFIAYYFRCLKSPSPLLSDWADAILRKGAAELAKKIKKKPEFDDPIRDWILARTEEPSANEIFSTWGPILKEFFIGLVSLFN